MEKTNEVIAQEPNRSRMSRRSFMGAMGVMGMMGAMGIMGGCAAQAPASEGGEEALGDTGKPKGVAAGRENTNMWTPAEIESIGGSIMPLYEINKRRRELIDSKGDYTKEDGTVVPAVYTKLRALTNTYLVGCGSEVNDKCFDFFQMKFTEDEAQAYLEMPMGQWFNVRDYALASGRPTEECAEICEKLAKRGDLGRKRQSGVNYYHQLALAHGFYEYGLLDYFKPGWTDNYRAAWSEDYAVGYMDSGTPFYYAIPVDKEVVSDDAILLTDDIEEIISRNSIFAVSPCQCRKIAMAINGDPEPPAIGTEELKDFMAPCGHPLETCLSFGEVAEYYIENGSGREITADEVRAIIKRSVEAGMILQSAFTKDQYVICSCHGDCCRILGVYKTAGPEKCLSSSSFAQTSNYVLNYDTEGCIQCGQCMAHCPVSAIEPDEDGYMMANGLCMRCGQCGTVCPAKVRTLSLKPEEEILERPVDLVDEYNMIAGYRFEHGTIY